MTLKEEAQGLAESIKNYIEQLVAPLEQRLKTLEIKIELERPRDTLDQEIC